MMNESKNRKLGDFTGLASNYSSYRPGYSPVLLKQLSGILGGTEGKVAADVGAGTGIWTRMLASCFSKVHAVEPNDDMRLQGQADTSAYTNVDWKFGNGESTGLAQGSVDLVSMASSFHWVDFDKGVQEFQRILKPGGVFVALWNPRLVERNAELVEAESILQELAPDMQRKSSGNSAFTDGLYQQLQQCGYFDDVIYTESEFVRTVSKSDYIGAWRSVNDVRAQLGEDKFETFIQHLEQTLSSEQLDVTYKTRAWLSVKG